MARGRMINCTIALDPEFNALSIAAQLCFLRTVPHLDRDGLIIGQEAALWATIAPLMPELLPQISGIIAEWKRAGLVVVYQTKIGPVLSFPAFHRNQVGFRYDREPESRLPLPQDCERTAEGVRQVSGNVPEDIRQISGNVPPEVEVEVEVEDQVQGKQIGAKAPPQRPPAVVIFCEVHHRNPKKQQYSQFDHITDLDAWRTVCETWRDRGYNPVNISGQLEWYADPSRMADQRNGYHAQPSKVQQSLASVDAAFEMLDERGIQIGRSEDHT